MKVFHGTLVHCRVPEKVEVLPDHVIAYEAGKIVFVAPFGELEALRGRHGFLNSDVQHLSESQFLMPGLVDTHIHAPQYMFTGTGYDKMLLEWLKTYTYPTEAMFKDLAVARQVYPLVVRRTLLHGTTTACYFATIHTAASVELARIIKELGQRALVGKVCMDQQSPDYYIEDTAASIQDTRQFITQVRELGSPLVLPVVTPRFAPSCSERLLQGLGQVAMEMGCHVQSHICEQRPEVEFTMKLFPGHKHTASIFDTAGLLTSKTVMAHCVYLEEEELALFKTKHVGVSHCPSSNLNIRSGLLDVRRILSEGFKIGLGTDVSGGYHPSVFDAMRLAVQSSKALSFTKDQDYTPISHNEALYMATLGGARVLSLDDKIGNFEPGKEFDALLVDVKAPQPTPVFDVFDRDTLDDRIQKFLHLGDDRNIIRRFVAGKEISL